MSIDSFRGKDFLLTRCFCQFLELVLSFLKNGIKKTTHANKERRLKDEKLEKEYPEVWSYFSLELVDKTLVNMLED